MVNNELEYKTNKNQKNKEKSTYPGEEVHTEENTGKQAVNNRLGDDCPVQVLYMAEDELLLPGSFYGQNEEEQTQPLDSELPPRSHRHPG